MPDTNCIVAASSMWHEHHHRATQDLVRRLALGQAMVIAAPTTVEVYAVLTRLPQPHRLSPARAITIIERFWRDAEIVALDVPEYVQAIQRAGRGGVAGGRIYDAVIGACARKAGVDALITFNERHFRDLVSDGIDVVVP